MTAQQESDLPIYQIAVLASLAHQPPVIPDERILILLGLTLWGLGRVSEAVTAFRLLDRNGALPMPGVMAWGWWLLYEADLADLDKAEDLFGRALKMEPDNDEASLGMAYLRFYQKEYRPSASIFSSLAARGKFSSPAVMAPAAKALAEGRHPEEVQMAPLLGLPPGLANVLQTRRLQGKDRAIQYAQSLAPLGPEENFLPIRRLILEWQLEDLEADSTHLRSELEGLLEKYPDEGRLWQFYGIVLRRLELRAESRDAFEHATTNAPLEAGTWAGFGASLMEAQELEQATHYYETATFLDPDSVQYLSELATCYAGIGQSKKAREKFTDAAERGASSFDLYFNRAVCSINLGDLGPAMEDLRAALEIDPTHRRAAEARKILQLERAPANEDRFRFGDL